MSLPPFRDDGWLPPGHYSIDWEEVANIFGGEPDSKREALLFKLIRFRDDLRECGCVGIIVLDGSFISEKAAPEDFDVLLILQPNIQEMKDNNTRLSRLLDAEMAECDDGISVFYAPKNSKAISELYSIFDQSKAGSPKGVLEVEL